MSQEPPITSSHMGDIAKKRIESIDVLRGLAMVIMALDHVRDYLHIGANTDDPLNLATTSYALFFTRWITHFCAPVFVFLSGTSIYLQSRRKSKLALSSFLIKRGLWLIFIEIAIISLAWTFNPTYPILPLQVIWVIGLSMVIMGLLIYLPFRVLLIMGIMIVAGHNLLDIRESANGFKPNFWWDILHSGHFVPYTVVPGHSIIVVYPFLPWVGVMMLGYCLGKFYDPTFSALLRRQRLLFLGFGLITLLIILRWSNIYGDPHPWEQQARPAFTFLSFLKLEKYPPSLLYLCMTIGPALILLATLEQVQNRLTSALRVFGRVAFFYYVLHLYLIHFIVALIFFARGHSWENIQDPDLWFPFLFVVAGEGFSLPIVYLFWIGVVVILYPLCKRYNQYKINHPEKWWLSYL